MVNLVHVHDYVVLFLIAAGFGALGGVAHMLITPGENTWFGFISSTFVGAVAAVAISYVFTPEVVVKAVNGTETRHWVIVRVIPLSIIVGAAGKAVLNALQARVLTAVKDAKVESVQKVAPVVTEQACRALAQRAVEQAASTARRPMITTVGRAYASLSSDLYTRTVPLIHSNRVDEFDQLAKPVSLDRWVEQVNTGLDESKNDAVAALEPEIQKQVEFVREAVAAAGT